MHRFLSALLTCLAVGLLAVAVYAQGPVRYVYDEAGRLVGVIDPNGDAAAYIYDAVGNLLGITRSTSSQVRILEFTPNAGPIGQTVTIYGTGFSATAAQNTVTFNGTSATVSSASTTMLTVAVPSGATTGTIAITSPNGSANSSSAFVVGADLTPTITSLTPTQGAEGTSVTIAGTNFQTVANQNLVAFNGVSAAVTAVTATSITTTVPTTATSGKVSVATPHGSATSASDFIIPPPSFITSDIEVTYRMTLGSSQNVTVNTSGKVALVLFDATAGQRVSLQATGSGPAATIRLYNHDGSQLATTSVTGSPGYIDATTLHATSSYTILVDPVGTATGTWTLTLNNVPADVTGTIPADGSNYGVTMSTPGQNARLTFSGTVGQRVSLKVSTGPGGNVTVLKPDRSVLATVPIGPVFATFMDTQTLTMAGTYVVVVDYSGTNTGSVTLNLYTVPADDTASIPTDGTAVTLTTTVAGQNGVATFTGTSGHRMSVWITGVSSGTTVISLRDATGGVLGSTTVGIVGGFLEPVTLTTTGAHSILMDPGGANTGSVTLRLYDVDADVSGSLTIGTAMNVSLSDPGQIASYAFSGTASQQITVRVTNSDINLPTGSNTTVNVKLVRADGTVLKTTTTGAANFNLVQTLPATETYTVIVDPTGPGIGTLTVTVTNP